MLRVVETDLDSNKSDDKTADTDEITEMDETDDAEHDSVNKELNTQNKSSQTTSYSDSDEYSDGEPVEERWTDSDSDDDEDIEIFLRLEPSITCLAFAAVLSSMTIGVIIVAELAVFFTTSIILKG